MASPRNNASLAVLGPPNVLDHETVSWAVATVRSAALGQGIRTVVGQGDAGVTIVLIAASDPEALTAEGLTGTPSEAESYLLRVVDTESGVRAVVASTDERGFAYALTELAERIRASGLDGLVPGPPEIERPATPFRSIERSFSSVDEDLPWFHDRRFWLEYLDFLAMQRFNRFHLALGMQYNYGTIDSLHATDNYLCFPYPFLLDVPGFRVRAQGVDAPERARNLATLAYIARETRRRGMGFQLGLWNHAYDYGQNPEHRYPILGVGDDSLADYSAAALRILLEEIPDIDGITFRVHYEGGIHEDGREVFWEKMFDAVSSVGRPLYVDLHAKGVDERLLKAVNKPNLRPMLSLKYWAEHMGLPYHQASIRERERIPPMTHEDLGDDDSVKGLTEISRRFTRYGYADFLDEDRDTDVIFRIWPGTQRLLLWGDPAIASGFGRCATFGGSLGLEFCEPLFFKGRKGSGKPGGREPYVADELRLGTGDWRKYRYTYLLWGRLLYNPDAAPETWRRFLEADYGTAASDVEDALAPLSRILPLVTVTHGPSAANNAYWPEVYADLPISPLVRSRHYEFDSDSTNWVGVSSFDPVLFYSAGEYADDILAGTLTGKYTPLEVANWLDRLASEGELASGRARAAAGEFTPQTERTLIDAEVLIHLGRFFARKFRAAVEYALFERTGDPAAIQGAVRLTEQAHHAYAAIPGIVRDVYQDNLAFGITRSERGHWSECLEAMADDLRALQMERDRAVYTGLRRATTEPTHREDRWSGEGVIIEGPEQFDRGKPIEIRLVGGIDHVSAAMLHYRRVNQSEQYEQIVMKRQHDCWNALVPGDFTDSSYPVMCFAEIRRGEDAPIFIPNLGLDLSNQPYLVIQSSDWLSRRCAATRDLMPSADENGVQ